jgi:hypothetical protein
MAALMVNPTSAANSTLGVPLRITLPTNTKRSSRKIAMIYFIAYFR